MKSHFELQPAEYEQSRQGHLHRRRIALVAQEVARLAPEAQVLELGCGSGDVLAALGQIRPDVRFLGVDLDPEMVDYANATHARGNVGFDRRDVVTAPPALATNLVFGIDVLHHVRDLVPFAEAVAALLVPSGRWLAIEPNSRNPYIWLHQERMRRAGLDEDHFRPARFESACRAAGLEVVERRTAFLVPGAVQRVPRAFARAERLLERVPVLGGSDVYVVGRA